MRHFIFALVFLATVHAQLSESAQEQLRELADSRGLKSTDSSLEDIAQAAQILSDLNALNDYAKVHGCKQATSKLLELDASQLGLPSVVYFKAEIYRLYECSTLSGVAKEIDTLLSKSKEILADDQLGHYNLTQELLDDQIYFAYLLQENAALYGTTPNDKFDQFVASEIANKWIKDFSPVRWTVKSRVEIQDGDEADTTFDVRELNIPMVKMTEVLAATMSREGLNTDVKSKLEEKLGKAFKQFVDNGGLYNEPGHAFFISKSSKVHSSTDLNAHLLRAIAKFNEHAASHLQIKLDLGRFRSFFFGKVLQGTDLSTAYTAMSALKDISTAEAPFVRVVSNEVAYIDQVDSVKLQFYDMVGTPIKFERELKQVSLVSDVSRDISIDVTAASKLSASEGQLVIDLKAVSELVPGSFWVQVRAGKQPTQTGIEYAAGTKATAVVLQTTKPFKVAVKVQHKALAFDITQESQPAADLLRGSLPAKHPERIGELARAQASDGAYMHVVAEALLVDSQGKQVGTPSQVYVAFKKDDVRSDEQLQVNAPAVYDAERERFVATMDFSEKMDLVNGHYKVSLVALDANALETVVWDLGQLEVWFKEGLHDANNQRMHENYFPKKEILSQFPPQDHREKSPILAFAGVAAIVVAFMVYLRAQMELSANTKRMDFWGSLLTVNILVLLGVIVAFWISINLIDTLWLLLALAPFSLFIFSKGLEGSADCEVEQK